MDVTRVKRTAEINVTVEGSYSSDSKRILRQAAKALDSVEGLVVTSIYIVRETHVPLEED